MEKTIEIANFKKAYTLYKAEKDYDEHDEKIPFLVSVGDFEQQHLIVKKHPPKVKYFLSERLFQNIKKKFYHT